MGPGLNVQLPVTSTADEMRSCRIRGIGEVIRDAYPDPSAKAGEPWVAVTTGALEPLPKPVI